MNTRQAAVYFAAALSATPAIAAPHEERPASWYATHPNERARDEAICREWASAAKTNPNCNNAFQGSIIAASREANARAANTRMAQANNAGVSNLGGPSVAFWRNPANAEQRAFWGNQCQKAEKRGASPEALEGMWCPAIRAAGGY